ncbi:MAG: hypothetical protein QXJ17_03495 [Nitrososphaeria archaeon]
MISRQLRIFLVFLTIVLLIPLIENTKIACPICNGEGKVKGSSKELEVEDYKLLKALKTCQGDTWKGWYVIQNPFDREITIRVYIQLIDLKTNSTRASTDILLKLGQRDKVNNTFSLLTFGENIEPVLKITSIISNEEQTYIRCPVCNGSGEVRILEYLKLKK